MNGNQGTDTAVSDMVSEGGSVEAEVSEGAATEETAKEKKNRIGARTRAFSQVQALLTTHAAKWDAEGDGMVSAYIAELRAMLEQVYADDCLPGEKTAGKPGRKPLLDANGNRVNLPRSLHHVGIRQDGSRVYLHSADCQQFASMFTAFAGPYKTANGAQYAALNGIAEGTPTFPAKGASERMS